MRRPFSWPSRIHVSCPLVPLVPSWLIFSCAHSSLIRRSINRSYIVRARLIAYRYIAHRICGPDILPGSRCSLTAATTGPSAWISWPSTMALAARRRRESRVASHMSRVTCRESRDAIHVSYVTYRESRVVSHVSRVTCRVSGLPVLPPYQRVEQLRTAALSCSYRRRAAPCWLSDAKNQKRGRGGLSWRHSCGMLAKAQLTHASVTSAGLKKCSLSTSLSVVKPTRT
jgi:hypothetical protein